jgi:hypothetical protein
LRDIENNGAGILYRGGEGYSEVIYSERKGLTAEIMTRSEKVYKLLLLEKYLLLGTESGNLK